METLFIICAAAGGTVMACQFALTLFGLGGEHDLHGDHDFSGGDHDLTHAAGHHEVAHDHLSSWFVGILTFRTIVAAVTFFGIGGWAGIRADLQPPMPWVIAIGAGACAMFLVAWLMRSLYGLQSEGNVRIDRAVGSLGTVYLPIPGQKAGAGKVLLNLQNRTVEYQAVTSQGELPTGAKIVVVSVVNSDTVEVAPATETERVVSHA